MINPAALKPHPRASQRLSGSIAEPAGLQEYVQVIERLNRGLRGFINEMTIVFRFIETVSGVHAEERILDMLMTVLNELCRYDAGQLYLFSGHDHPKETLRRSVHGDWVEQYRRRLKVDDRIYQWVYRQGHAVIIPDTFGRRRAPAGAEASFMIAPLYDGVGRLGRIELLFKRPQGTFTQQLFSILNVLLRHAALILSNEKVYEKERATLKKYIELDMLKQDVVHTTTHEIKTPLTIIQASSILLERRKRMRRSDQNELLRSITHQCGKINQIVTELFETAQLEENHPPCQKVPVSLHSMTREVLRDILYDMKKHTIDVRGAGQWPMVLADRSSLYKVFRNLIENAIKYSPRGGVIRIRAGVQAGRGFWSITDRGIGIAAEDQTKIFDKFFRAGDSATRSVRGLGFGLYIVKKNVELNHGTLSVKSRLNQGSTFTVRLPLARRRTQPRRMPRSAAATPKTNS